MPNTKRIVLNLSSTEFAELERVVRDAWNKAAEIDTEAYQGQTAALFSLFCKVQERYGKWGCP